MRILLATTALLLIFTRLSAAQSETIFSGAPVIKISEGGVERFPEKVSKEKASNLRCVISRIEGKYYWASRENKELLRTVSGAFITFFAIDGSGYVRIIPPELKGTASLMAEAESKFDYVEHLLIGLRHITYYGVMN